MTEAPGAFDGMAEEYDAWFDSPKGKVLFKAEVEAVRVLTEDLMPPFLEVGVGSGRFAGTLGIGHGIDPSAALLDKARTRGIEVMQGKGEDLPYDDDCFGGVFILFALCFVDNPAGVLTEARRVLRPDGGLIVGIINRQSPWGLLYAKKKSAGHPLYEHARFYSPGEVVGMLQKTGMSAEAFSSTLLKAPSDNPREEPVLNRLQEGAGFVCVLSRKRR